MRPLTRCDSPEQSPFTVGDTSMPLVWPTELTFELFNWPPVITRMQIDFEQLREPFIENLVATIDGLKATYKNLNQEDGIHTSR